MKVVHIVTVPESLFFLRGQGEYFGEHGVEIVAISSPDAALDSFGDREGIRTIGIPLARKISPLADLASIWKLLRVLRKERPDIVHAHTPKGGLLGTIASRLARVPVTIYHIRGLPYMVLSGMQRRLLMTTEWVSCKLANQVFSVSHSIADVAVADRLVPPEKIKVLLKGSGNGVDTRERFNPANTPAEDRLSIRTAYGIPDDAVVCLFVGRITADKGVRELAEAWQKVAERHPDAYLLVLGAQDARLPLDSKSMRILEALPSVILAGKQSNTNVYYAASNMVILPTYREGFPNVLLEAAAMGKAAIATDVPGCIDAIEDGVTGDLVPVKDADALADAIAALIADPERRKYYGAAARKRVVEYFDSRLIWEAMLAEYTRLFKHHTKDD